MRHLLLILAFLTAVGIGAAAAKTPVQQWYPTAASVMKVDTKLPTGDAAITRMQIQNFTPDIQFDPRDLKNSRVMLTAIFMPVELPGHQVIDDETKAQASAVFLSEDITQKDDNAFQVRGFFRMNGQMRQLIFDMNVVASPTTQRPVLIFSGQFYAPVGHMAPRFGLPAQIPVVFHVETRPNP